MKTEHIVSGCLFAAALVMLAAIGYGIWAGNGLDEVRELFTFPWFNVTMIDVYVGFGLFCGWIGFRERSIGAAATWIMAVLLLGNLVTCVYALVAVAGSRGDWARFWLGANAGSLEAERPGDAQQHGSLG